MLSALRRVGHPADIVDIVSYLVSDDARSITGQTLDASGGTTPLSGPDRLCRSRSRCAIVLPVDTLLTESDVSVPTDAESPDPLCQSELHGLSCRGLRARSVTDRIRPATERHLPLKGRRRV
ncbi:SDR family oxidoreductase [Nocardia salmonicida]|uniref:SDR family oxidoreductase n=1 Tax=Nocardia salmonicida TaxID=53431 RepID=UPI0012F4A397|nr:SDR family oxidoreductase [Nocardia salmonicida]